MLLLEFPWRGIYEHCYRPLEQFVSLLIVTLYVPVACTELQFKSKTSEICP